MGGRKEQSGENGETETVPVMLEIVTILNQQLTEHFSLAGPVELHQGPDGIWQRFLPVRAETKKPLL